MALPEQQCTNRAEFEFTSLKGTLQCHKGML